jgi:dihydrolipoamide dehydrogenase
MTKYDVAVVGGGPGGYAAALRLAQLGRRPVLFEEARVGGECTNWGCIPTKALISMANLLEKFRRASEQGIHASDVRLDWKKLQAWKEGVVNRLVSGIEYLLNSYGVELVRGRAVLAGERRVKVVSGERLGVFEVDQVVLATGSRPATLPALPLDGEYIISSREAVTLQDIPSSMVVVGGGVVGVELGTMYRKLGVEVTIVEVMDQILPGVDPELVRVVSRSLQSRDVKVLLRSTVTECTRAGGGLRLRVNTPHGPLELFTEKVLVAVGRRPRSQDMGLEELGVEMDPRGFVKTDRQTRTNLPWLYAIGDVAGPPLLAHKAYREAQVAAEASCGRKSTLDYRALPDVIFSDPEVARVGLTEDEARSRGLEPVVGRYPFAALGRALTSAETEGFVKIVADKASGQLLGAAIVGPHASDLISELALAIEMGATVADIALTIHPHPTFPEAVMEACASAWGQPLHQVKAR